MISKTTFNIIRYVVSLGSILLVLPWKWNEKKGLVIHRSELRLGLWEFILGAHILGRIAIEIYLVLVMSLLDLESWEFIFLLIPCTLFALFLCSEIYVYRRSKEFQMASNAFVVFNNKLRKLVSIRVPQLGSETGARTTFRFDENRFCSFRTA